MKQTLLLIFCFLIWNKAFLQNSVVDFKRLEAEINILPKKEKIQGNLVYTLDILQETDTVFVDAVKMRVENVEFNGEKIEFYNDDQRVAFISDFKESPGNKLNFSYSAEPQKAMYFIGWQDSISEESISRNQVWTQGQGRKTSNWLPSFDDTNEKLEFDLHINFPGAYEVVANGELAGKEILNDSVVQWRYNMQKPISSYLVAVAAGKYDHIERSVSGTPLLLYYYPQKKEVVEPTYRYSVEIFEFLEKEIGMPYPWVNYKQIPVRDFIFSGMENVGTTIFSDLLLTDSIAFKDRNYVMVDAHELAHQWFGNLVTAKFPKDHWLQEGFATYYALLAEKEIFGEDYFYWRLLNSAEQLKERSSRGEGEPVMTRSGNSLTYYQKGAWALHALRNLVGEKDFRAGVKNFLEKNKFENATTEDLLAEIENVSGKDLSEYKENWLQQSTFQAYEAYQLLKRSDFIQNYLKMLALRDVSLFEKKQLLKEAFTPPVNDYIVQEAVYQLASEDIPQVTDLYKRAFATGNIWARQAIATSLREIPPSLKKEYESLLFDESYLTKELAFYNLWMNFPENRRDYLDQMKGIEGFTDKNIEILWLALNLATPDYEPEEKSEVYQKLTGYTSAVHPFYVQENAFRYLFQLNAFERSTLKNLVLATQSHVSGFRKFSRDMLKQLLQNENYSEELQNLLPELPEKNRKYLKTLLENYEIAEKE